MEGGTSFGPELLRRLDHQPLFEVASCQNKIDTADAIRKKSTARCPGFFVYLARKPWDESQGRP